VRFAVLPLLAALAGCLTDVPPSGSIRSVTLAPAGPTHFSALHDTLGFTVQVVDLDGDRVDPGHLTLISRDPSIVRMIGETLVESVGNGSTWIIASADGTIDSIGVTVSQVSDTLLLQMRPELPVTTVGAGAFLPLSCRVFDASGQLLDLSTSVTSATGVVSGTSCDNLTATSSGLDTLSVQAGGYSSRLAVAVAIRPTLGSDPAAPFPVDSIPAGFQPWAPTLRRTPSGALELYFAGYVAAPEASNGLRGHLYRLVSSDGVSFQFDGIALRRSNSLCDPQGTGIENVAIVPRSDGAGWRMFYAAGGYDCYGWQVFSAVSGDGLSWTKESGARVNNGGTLPPATPVTAPWPSGEGINIDRLPNGTWRMLTGAYERSTPRENRFQIIEWRSSDQLKWTYQGPVLTTRQVGPEVNRSIASPSVVTLAPGLYRMFFSGDNLNDPGGASGIYTAVSRDFQHWQVEGVLVSDPATRFYYSSVVGNLLAFIREPVNQPRSLGLVQVVMP
jgi:hypothetical protein